jgi:hypothetical protein
MRDNCFKIESTQIDHQYCVAQWCIFTFDVTQKTSSLCKFFRSIQIAYLSLFPIQIINDYYRKLGSDLFKNILSRRVDTKVSVSKCSLLNYYIETQYSEKKKS